MKYSINIKNTETGEEEVISGNNVNDVLQRVSDNIISIKKNVKMIYGDQSFIRQMEGTELRKLELGTKKENAQKATDEMKLKEADVLYERELKNWKVLIDKIELENTRKEDNYRKIFNEITIENQKNFEIWFKDKEQFESSLNYKRQQF